MWNRGTPRRAQSSMLVNPSFSVGLGHTEVPSVDVAARQSGVHTPQNGGNYGKRLCNVRVEKPEVGPGDDILKT